MTNVFLALTELPVSATFVRDGITYMVLDPAKYDGVSLSQLSPTVFLLDGSLFHRSETLLQTFAGTAFPEATFVEVTRLNKIEFIKRVREATMLGLKHSKWLADGLWAKYAESGVLCRSSPPQCWTNPRKFHSYGVQLTVTIGGQYGTPTTTTISIGEEYSSPEKLFKDLFTFCQNDAGSWLSRQSYTFKVMASSSHGSPSMSTGDIIVMTNSYAQHTGSIWASSVWQVTSGGFIKLSDLRPF